MPKHEIGTEAEPARPGGRALRIAAGVAAGAAIAAGAVIVVRRLRRRSDLRRRTGLAELGSRAALAGLSDEEAAARRPDIDLGALEAAQNSSFIRRAVRTNLFTIFNLDMFAIASLMFLLGSPISGVGTLAVLTANVVIHVGQEVLVKRRLDQLIAGIRPRITVIRAGAPRRLRVRDVVRGDLLAVGLGDEIPVTGVVVRASRMRVAGMAELADPARDRGTGDPLEAGGYCVGGHGVYRAEEAGAERVARRPVAAQLLEKTLTPLEILVRRVLFSLLAVMVFYSFLLVTGSYIPRGTPTSEEAYRNALSLVFNIAPTSLFFLLVISYVMGLLDVARRGGLVYRPATVESLAAVATVCIGGRSVISGAQVTLDPIERPGEAATGPGPEETRRLLGDVMQSAPADTTANELIAAALPGTRREPLEMAGNLSVYGWQAVSFDEPELRGTFVVGVAEVVELGLERPRLQVGEDVAALATESKAAAERGVFRARGFLGRFRRRGKGAEDARTGPAAAAGNPPSPLPAATAATGPAAVTAASAATGLTAAVPVPASVPGGPSVAAGGGRRARILGRIQRALAPRDSVPTVDLEGATAAPRTLLFAYRPEPAALIDAEGEPVLPDRLVALAEILVTETVSPEAIRSVRSLQLAGIRVVLMSGADAASVRRLAGSLGVNATIDFSGLDGAGRKRAIDSLRSGPALVAGVAHGLGEVSAMQSADVGIALRSASQAALAAADVIMVEDTLSTLPAILAVGRRIVNGVMAMLKLNLTHIGTQLGLLTVAFLTFAQEFPYTPVQSGAITAFSIAIPSIMILLLAPSRRPSPSRPSVRLTRFVVPSSTLTIVMTLIVFTAFRGYTGSVATAQLATTWLLVAAGMIRVLLVLPPNRVWAGAEPVLGDPRVYGLIGIASGLFLTVTAIPLTRGWIGMNWLPSGWMYLVLAGALIVWTGVQIGFWRLVWREPAAAGEPVLATLRADPSMAGSPS